LTPCARAFPDQAIAVAAGREYVDQHDVGQQFGDLGRIEIGAARHRLPGRFLPPILKALLEPRIADRRSGRVRFREGCGRRVVGLEASRLPICVLMQKANHGSIRG